LGWTLKKDIFIPNYYGLDQYFKTNSMGFRNNKDFSPSIPPDKIRILCSGDSFTMGAGVSNDHTWCSRLSQQNNLFEVVNLGINGYGVDQAYLKFLRVNQYLDHDILLFAFITDDFNRMARSYHYTRPKPVLRIKDDAITISKISFFSPVSLIIRNFERSRASALFVRKTETFKWQTEVASLIFDDLQEKSRNTNSILVLVHIPKKGDHSSNKSMPWRNFLHKKAREDGLHLIDLFNELKKIPRSEIDDFFIPAGLLDVGHMSIKGNDYFARLFYQRMLEIPEIADRLTQKERDVKANLPVNSVGPEQRTSLKNATGN